MIWRALDRPGSRRVPRPNTPQLRRFILAILVPMWVLASARADDSQPERDRSTPARQTAQSIGQFLEQTLLAAQPPLPSLAVTVFAAEGEPLVVARGVRRLGTDVPVTPQDHYHFGSITKSMTATVIAMAVAEGRLDWDQTLPRLPGTRELAWPSGVSDVTLGHLLRHRSGLPTDLPEPLWRSIRRSTAPPRQQRLEVARSIATTKHLPAGPFPPYQYSNTNYILAAVALEAAYDEPCETLIARRLFEPLKMTGCGWGPVGLEGSTAVDLATGPRQPCGHDEQGTPIAPGPLADNPGALWPGGGVHGPLADLARFGQFHLGQGEHPPGLLTADQLARLHQPLNGQSYALGWHVLQRDWARGSAWTHNGTNTMNFAVLWLAPARQWGVAVATNQGGRHAELVCDAVAAEMVTRFLKDQD